MWNIRNYHINFSISDSGRLATDDVGPVELCSQASTNRHQLAMNDAFSDKAPTIFIWYDKLLFIAVGVQVGLGKGLEASFV